MAALKFNKIDGPHLFSLEFVSIWETRIVSYVNIYISIHTHNARAHSRRFRRKAIINRTPLYTTRVHILRT